MLRQKQASITRSISEAVVLKDGDVYFLAEPDGDVSFDRAHGVGLFFHDCRYLDGYTLRIGGEALTALGTGFRDKATAEFHLTNPALQIGRERLSQDVLAVTWTRRLDGHAGALDEELCLANHGVETVTVPVELAFRAAFEDVFSVRGLLDERPGRMHRPAWRGGALRFRYDGRDDLTRTLTVRVTAGRGVRVRRAGAAFRTTVRLTAQAEARLRIRIAVREHGRARIEAGSRPHRPAPARRLPEIETGHTGSNRTIATSLRDLDRLQSTLLGEVFVAAGVPWFVTLFGRDSLIVSLQMLAFDVTCAADTLRLLARYQGSRDDAFRDEQPGKILHELRVGELARIGAIPHSPYYGSVDATPLFLIVLARHAAWTGSLELFHELRAPVERALAWMDGPGDANGDGYLEYDSASGAGLVNQGWKDSGDAIVNHDGSLARPPIAMVEVQGYAYRARLELAALYARAGEPDRAAALRARAARLRARFRRDFWMPRRRYLALALQRGGARAEVIASNAGQALWAGIVAPAHARAVAARLLHDDLWSGWGVRTLSSREARYNPGGYHTGSVWPHDNAILAAGLKAHGFDAAAMQIAEAMFAAAATFPEHRLPELFTGYPRAGLDAPFRYPVACHPQGWAAGSVPMLLTMLLGLEPDAFAHRLTLRRPRLPARFGWLELRGLVVGDARVDLRVEQRGAHVRVEHHVHGRLQVVVERARGGAARRRTRARRS